MSPRRIAPFLRGKTWWARVPRIGNQPIQRSLGVADEGEAVEMVRFLEWLRGRGARSAYVLEMMATGETPVLAAYGAYVENRLDAFEMELRQGVADPDIEPYVARWEREMQRQKRPNDRTRATYIRQVRTLLADGTAFPRSTFTRQRIRDWLNELEIGQPNRFRAALSSFAQYLVFEDVLQSNPVRLVPMAQEREPRSLHLSPADADRLIDAIEAPYRIIHAIMACTGMEISAALALKHGDLTADSAFAAGTKRHHRRRTCTIYYRWAPLWDRVVMPWLRDLTALPNAPLFADVTPWKAYREMKKALATEALKDLPQDYTSHDHRHTWAVQAVRDGLALHTIAHQLGHRDATMILKVYGRFQPTARDFGVDPEPFTSNNATTPKAIGGRK